MIKSIVLTKKMKIDLLIEVEEKLDELISQIKEFPEIVDRLTDAEIQIRISRSMIKQSKY